MRSLLIVTLFFLFSSTASACSCLFTNDFCSYVSMMAAWDTTGTNTVVARVRLREIRLPEPYVPLYDFAIEEVLLGRYGEENISLVGQNGFNCNGPYERLETGEELIIVFGENEFWRDYGRDSLNNPYPVSVFPGCGESYLKVVGSEAVGQVTEELLSVRLTSVGDQLAECLPADHPLLTEGEPEVVVGEAPFAISVYPNPAQGRFTVLADATARVRLVELYTIRGRFVGSVTPSCRAADGCPEWPVEVPVPNLPAGVYYVVVWAEKASVRQKIVIL